MILIDIVHVDFNHHKLNPFFLLRSTGQAFYVDFRKIHKGIELRNRKIGVSDNFALGESIPDVWVK